MPSLHGRETELALIDGLFDRIDQSGSALVFSGAPGIGKSALLEEAKNRARERGIIVLGMTGVLAEIHLAYAGLERALRPLVNRARSLAPHQRSLHRRCDADSHWLRVGSGPRLTIGPPVGSLRNHPRNRPGHDLAVGPFSYACPSRRLRWD